MPKQGQHRNDIRDSAKSRGPNNPAKSTVITTGTYKKKETYAIQAAEGKATNKIPQNKELRWQEDTRDPRRLTMLSANTPTRARQGDLDSGRSGSDSNASAGTRGH